MSMQRCTTKIMTSFIAVAFALSGCAPVNVPDGRNVSIPSPAAAPERREAVNERPDSVMYLPLGDDVLVPEVMNDEPLPSDQVGPFELRGETLAGALQLILADYDVPMAFETDEAFNRFVTVANLHGDLDKVVRRVCSLANLYCSYEDGVLVVKDTQTFTVTVPPVGVSADGAAPDTATFLTNVASGLGAILGGSGAPIIDQSTRTIVYTATQRTAELAARYFQRVRANTAMIVFETYIWEVQLNSGNSTGINWDQIDSFGKFSASVSLDGGVDTNFVSPVSIGLPTTQSIGATPTDLVEFLSRFGAVKAISQPQISVLSGSTAQLRVAETENYVSEISTTITDNQSTTAVDTDSVDSGFTLTIDSSWDKSTVYANIQIVLTDVLDILNFTFSDGGAAGTSTQIQLPQTTERQLSTQVRVRPGDSILIAGLVQEKDNFNTEGPGVMEPILPQSRTALTENLEVVFLLRPRVIVYTAPSDTRLKEYAAHATAAMATAPVSMSPPAAAAPMYSGSLSAGGPADGMASMPAGISAGMPSIAPVESEPVSAAPAAGGPAALPRSVYKASPAPSPSSAPVSSSGGQKDYSSGYVSKYLGSSQSQPSASPQGPASGSSSGGAVEIYDADSVMPGQIDGASAPVPLSSYSTYGAEGGGAPNSSLYETSGY